MDLQSEIASDLAEIRRLHARAKSLRKLFIGLDFGITCTGISCAIVPSLETNITVIDSPPAPRVHLEELDGFFRCDGLDTDLLKTLNPQTHLQRLIQVLDRLLLQWLSILQRLLFFCMYAEFPNRLRPPCTTMPWTIWPSLVVLWGVCWMFYYGEGPQEEVYPLAVSLGETAEQVGDLQWDTGFSIDSMLASSLFQDQPYQQSFDFPAELYTWSLPAANVENPVPSPLAAMFSQLAVPATSAFPESTSAPLIESDMPATPLAQGDFSSNTMPETETTPTALAMSSESPTSHPVFPCPAPNCSRTFRSKALLHNHEKRYHTKPFKCTLTVGNRPCTLVFGRAYELKRHQASVHKMVEKVFFCSVVGCKYARGTIPSLPFLRRDKLLQHQRQVGHGDSVDKNQLNETQSAGTTLVASGLPGGDAQMQVQAQTQTQVQDARHFLAPIGVQAEGERGEIELSRNANLGEASRNLVAKVKDMQDRHAAEMKRLKEEQEREMRVLKEELEEYERQIVIAREFLGH